jgi:hypothetical protein
MKCYRIKVSQTLLIAFHVFQLHTKILIIYFFIFSFASCCVFAIWNSGTVNTTYVNKNNRGTHICFYLLTTCFDLSRGHHQVILIIYEKYFLCLVQCLHDHPEIVIFP